MKNYFSFSIFHLFFGGNFLFGAVQKPFDIVFMSYDDQQGCQKCDRKGKKGKRYCRIRKRRNTCRNTVTVEQFERYRRNRIDCCIGDGAQGNDFGDGKHYNKNQ